MGLLKIFQQYNRKERNYVANYFLIGDRNFGEITLHSSFLRLLDDKMKDYKYFASFEYNYDWIYASLLEDSMLEDSMLEDSMNISFPLQRINTDHFIKGQNNSDIDLFIAFEYKNGKYDLYFIEAKYGSECDVGQINKKLSLLDKLLQINSKINNVNFLFCSDNKDANNTIMKYANKARPNKTYHISSILLPPNNAGDKSIVERLKSNANVETTALIEFVINGSLDYSNIQDPVINELQKTLGSSLKSVSNNAIFLALDYPIKHIFNSLDMKSPVSGRLDVDAICVIDGGIQMDFILCEAKVYTPWDKGQLGEKINAINILYDEMSKKLNVALNMYFITMNRIGKNTTVEGLTPNVKHYNIEIPLNEKFATQRCDKNGNPNKNGDYWKKKIAR